MTQRMTLFERFWHFLPDRCEMPECKKPAYAGTKTTSTARSCVMTAKLGTHMN